MSEFETEHFTDGINERAIDRGILVKPRTAFDNPYTPATHDEMRLAIRFSPHGRVKGKLVAGVPEPPRRTGPRIQVDRQLLAASTRATKDEPTMPSASRYQHYVSRHGHGLRRLTP